MRKRVLAALAVCLFAAGSFAQTPTPTTTTSPLQPQAGNLDELVRQMNEKQKEMESDLKSKAKEINDLKDAVKNAATVEKKLVALDASLNAVTEANREAASKTLDLDEIRYRAGKEIIMKLIEDSGQLQVATDLGKNMSQHGASVNPAMNTNYKELVTFLQGKAPDTNKGVLEQLVGGASPLMANPYVSLAFTVGSFLTSKLKPAENKLGKATDLACVVDYTSRVAPDVRVIQFNLTNVDQRLSGYHSQMKARFRDYAQAINLDLTYDQYVERMAAGADPFRAASEKFFNDLRANTKAQQSLSTISFPSDVGVVRFQIENVKGYLLEYEGALKGVDDFFGSYMAILKQEIDETVKPGVCKSDMLKETRETLTSLSANTAAIRNNIKERFHLKLQTPSKKLLYGITN